MHLKLPFHITIGLPNFLWFRKDTVTAFVIGIFILYRKEKGLPNSTLIHETVHIAQFYRHPISQPFLYNMSNDHRLAFEAEAFAKQLIYLASYDTLIDTYRELTETIVYKDKLYSYGKALFLGYGLNKSLRECHKALRNSLCEALIEAREERVKGNLVSWVNYKI